MKEEGTMPKKKNPAGWPAADVAGLCRRVVAEACRAKRTTSSEEGFETVLVVVDRVSREILYCLMAAIKQARDENLTLISPLPRGRRRGGLRRELKAEEDRT